MANILFLDFDGVLHHSNVVIGIGTDSTPVMKEREHELFQFAGILEKIVNEHASESLKIVLSTAWVRVKGYDYACAQLPQSIQSRLVGATFDPQRHDEFSFCQTPRGEQIAAWLADNKDVKVDSFMCLDDDDYYWPSWMRDNLIHCAEEKGISDPKIQAALIHYLKVISR